MLHRSPTLVRQILRRPCSAMGTRSTTFAISRYQNFVARLLTENHVPTGQDRCELLHSRLGIFQCLCRFHPKRSAVLENSQNVERWHHDGQVSRYYEFCSKPLFHIRYRCCFVEPAETSPINYLKSISPLNC
jgi:hypothetical protein